MSRLGRDVLLGWVFLAATLSIGLAQTVRPVIVEYTEKARGKFELVNNDVQPLSVVIEPRSFTITEGGDAIYRPLAADIHLKLSAMSFRIPPRQSRFVFYEASADTLPAAFVIYSTLATRQNRGGINVQIDLPHTVYLVQKQPLSKDDVVVESAAYSAKQHRVEVTIVNRSARFGRVLEWQVSAKRTRETGAGFPLLPQARRRMELEWTSPLPPSSLSIAFNHFTIKQDLGAAQE